MAVFALSATMSEVFRDLLTRATPRYSSSSPRFSDEEVRRVRRFLWRLPRWRRLAMPIRTLLPPW